MFTQGFVIQYSPLDYLGAKTQGVITAIRNKDEKIVKKLLAMGVHTGMHITLEQRSPSFIIILATFLKHAASASEVPPNLYTTHFELDI